MNRTAIYVLAAIVLAADQVTKQIAVQSLANFRQVVLVPDFLDFTLVINTGGAFGILKDGTWWLVLVALAAIIGIVTYAMRSQQPFSRMTGTALALPLGGAIGNLVDRVRLHHVVDFIHAHAGTHEWPVFNVADSCICIGVGLLAINLWLRPEASDAANVEPAKVGAVSDKDSS